VITLIEALRFRCLRDVRQPLGPFRVLVGPNGSGKSTFLSVVSFLGLLVADGPEAAVEEQSTRFQDLTWGRDGLSFELAVEARIPEERRSGDDTDRAEVIRYEIALGVDDADGAPSLMAERVILRPATKSDEQMPIEFPRESHPIRESLLTLKGARRSRTIVSKARGGNDTFRPESSNGSGKRWAPSFKLGPMKSALGNLPEDESAFPASTWLKRLLIDGVQPFVLNSLLIKRASPPGRSRGFQADGSNLPWLVAELERSDPERLKEWVAHLRTALPDLEAVRTREREDDRHRYLVLRYSKGPEIPSWLVSDGTLRLLALTLPAYLHGLTGILLIEEPENGIHPRAVSAAMQSLSSVYEAQILVATHSPVVLSIVDPADVLCFARAPSSGTDIIGGSSHPALRGWKGETDLGTLFAGGVLG